MQVKAWLSFDSKAERSEFIKLLNSAKDEKDAFYQILAKFKGLDAVMLQKALHNFTEEIGKNTRR